MILKEEILKYFQSQYPREACGVILDTLEFIPAKNLCHMPNNSYILDPSVWIKYDNIKAIVHSHPNGSIFPSDEDIKLIKLLKPIIGIIGNNEELAMYKWENNLVYSEFTL